MDLVDNQPLYKRDEYTWLREQIALLRKRSFDTLDCDHLAEFLEDMAAQDRRELRTHMV